MVAELTVEKLVYGGCGLARQEGLVVLVPYVLPGERIRVELEPRSSDYARGRLVEILESSPHRVAPPCPYFGRCGGCHYQHAAYSYQLELKRAILRETFQRIARLELPGEIRVISGPDLGYRNRVQLHIRAGRVGFHEAGSHRLCPVDQCVVCSPRLNEAIQALARMARQPRFPQFVRVLELFTNEDQTQVNVLETQADRRVARGFFEWCARLLPGALDGSLDYWVGSDVYRVSHRSFFQVNRFLLEPLLEVALGEASGQFALDLYAGVGLFSLPLARKFREVVAVESAASAVADLEFNAQRAGLPVKAVRSTVELFLEQQQQAPDFLVADPPRAGLGKAVVRQLLRLRVPRLSLVSCDPATLARDVGGLVQGGYEVREVSLVDLFPHTYHIETVCRLEWGS